MAGKELTFAIKIKATEVEPGVWEHVAEEIENVGDESEDAGEKSKKAADDTGKSVVKWTALYQVGKKVIQETIQAIGAWLDSSIKARAETDAGAIAWKKHAEEIEKTRALLGDILVPIVLALADAFQPLLAAFQTWLKSSRDLQEGGLAQWLVRVGDILIDAITGGVIIATSAWAGMKVVIDSLRIVFNKFFELQLFGLEKTLGLIARLAGAAGLDGLSSSLSEAADTAKLMGDTLSEEADASARSIIDTVTAQADLNMKIFSMGDTVKKAFDTAAIKHFGEEVKKSGIDPLDEAMGRLNKMADFLKEMRLKDQADSDAASARRAAVLEREIQDTVDAHETIREITKETREAQERDAAAVADAFKSGFGSLLAIGKEAFDGVGDVVDGRKKTILDAFKQIGKGFLSMIAENTASFLVAKGIEVAAEKAAALVGINAKAADAAAGAASSQASIPIVGPALAVAAMVAMLATVGALAGSFNTGGQLRGPMGTGGPNRDSVLFVGTPGEVVLDRDASAFLIRALSGKGGAGAAPPSSSQNPSPQGGSSSGGRDQYVPFPVPMYMPSSRTDVDRITESVTDPAYKRLRRQRKRV